MYHPFDCVRSKSAIMFLPARSYLRLLFLVCLVCLGTTANAEIGPPIDIQVNGAEVLQQSATPVTTSAGLFPNSNIRYTRAIGVRTNGREFPELGWFRRNWEGPMSRAVSTFPAAFSANTAAVLGKGLRWRDCLVDSSLFMTVAEMADPGHPNYIWNQPSRDGLTEALNDPLVRGGTAKIALVVGDTASGSPRSVPLFMVGMNLSFGGNGNENETVLRLDRSLARDYSVAFYSAILRRWGNDAGLHTIILGEYFAGNSANFPSDFTLAEHVRGRASMWQRIVDAAPLDDNGNRVAIVQSSPLLNSGVTAQDLVTAKVGVSQPDPDIFQHGCGSELPENKLCEPGSVSRGLQDLFGVVPSFITQDDRYARLQRQSGGWPSSDGLPNPFGIGPGERVVASIEHVMWYRCNVVPTDGTMFQLSARGVADDIWDEAALFKGIGRFGAGGSERCGQGAFPPSFN